MYNYSGGTTTRVQKFPPPRTSRDDYKNVLAATEGVSAPDVFRPPRNPVLWADGDDPAPTLIFPPPRIPVALMLVMIPLLL